MLDLSFSHYAFYTVFIRLPLVRGMIGDSQPWQSSTDFCVIYPILIHRV